MVVQNLSGQATTAWLTYYPTGGGGPLTSVELSLAAYSSGVVNNPPLSNFVGSVVIEADQDIVAAIQVQNSASTGDTHATYNASNR